MGQKLSIKNEKKNNKDDFIFYVKKNIRKYYKNIQNNKNNYLIALEKKYFDEENNFKNKINLNNNIKITNWKEYFINYIEKNIEKGNLFFDKILKKIKKETFLSENKYLSSIFFYDFELTTKPEILNKIDKKINKNESSNVLFKNFDDYSNNNNNNNIIDDNLTNDIKKLNFNFFNDNQNNYENNNNNNLSLSKIVLNLDNFNESFYNSENNSNKSSFISNENFNLKTIKKRIKKIINIFKEHLINKDHPITILIIIFEEEFSIFLYEKINEMKDLKNDENYENKINILSDKLIKFIKTFIIKIQTCLKLFYCSALNLNYLHYENDQTINLCSSLLFNIGNLYSNFYDFFNLLLNDEIENFSKLLNKNKNITFDDLNIPIRFRLNFETKKLILNLKNKNNENFFIDDENNNNEINKNNNEINKNNNEINKNEEDGYLNVINKLKSIQQTKIPFEKMLIISSLPKLITSNINDFYFPKENENNYLSPNYLNLISDDLISIFIYILIKSQMSSILIHLKIMNEFIPKSTQKNNYYITTLKCAIQFIQQNEIIKINNNNNKYFEINS